MLKDSKYYKARLTLEPHTLDSMREIADNFMEDGADRVMYALEARNYKSVHIENLVQYLEASLAKMNKEKRHMEKFEGEFEQSFATDDNEYFPAIAIALKHMRSHTSPLMKILERTCPARHPNRTEREKYGLPQKNALTESTLAQGAYVPDLFGTDSFPPIVNQLITLLEQFFGMIDNCVDRCDNVVEREKTTRENPGKCEMILDDYLDKFVRQSGDTASYVPMDTVLLIASQNPLCISYKKCATKQEFAQKEYHMRSIKTMNQFCPVDMATALSTDMTKEEYAIWGNSPKKALKARTAARNFDSLLPAKMKKGDFSKYVYAFCAHTAEGTIKQKYQYLKDIYENSGEHKYSLPSYNSVNKRSKDYDRSQQWVKDFYEAIDKTAQTAENTEKNAEKQATDTAK